MELGLVFFIITLTYLFIISQSVRFNLESGVTKCISEELKVNSMSVGQYSVVNPNAGHPLPEHHKLYFALFTPKEDRTHHAEDVESGEFVFEAVENGKHSACFATINHEPTVNTSVEFNWRSGVTAKGWSNVAKKGSVDPIELELQKMEETVNSIHEEMFYLWLREHEMLELSMKTNSTMGLLSLVSLFLSLSVAGLQLWHLKSFFEKKKII